MFHLKFIRYYGENEWVESNISCPNYSVGKSEKGVCAVTTYTDFTDVNGVERKVYKDRESLKDELKENFFDVCYVTNSAGETVSKIR